MLPQSVKNVVGFLADTATKTDQALVDGWQWPDGIIIFGQISQLPAVIPDFKPAVAFIRAGLSEADRTELNELFKVKFDLTDDKVERKVEASVKLLLAFEEWLQA